MKLNFQERIFIWIVATIAILELRLWFGFGSIYTSLIVFIATFLFLKVQHKQLDGITKKIKDGGKQMSSSCFSVLDQVGILKKSAFEAADSIQATLASTDEISSMIKSMVRMSLENSENAKKLTSQCEVQARKGKEQVQELIAAMTEITKSSKQIEEIISLIDDIAFQTNLLALNASVEAARAGDQGKGFAVVASAVRSLAHRSAISAKEITVLIKSSVDQIQLGSRLAEASGKSLEQIVSSVERVSLLNLEMANSSKDQAEGITSMNQVILEKDTLIQKNLEISETTAEKVKALYSQSQTVESLSDDLSKIIEGDGGVLRALRLRRKASEENSDIKEVS